MEGAEIGLVLAHAAELRSKISECIQRNGGERLAKRKYTMKKKRETTKRKETSNKRLSLPYAMR